MSVSFNSWESIFKLTKHFYNPQLPLYFTSDHVRLLCEMIAHLGNYTSFTVIYTKLPMIEPIIKTPDNLICISIPLVAKFINMPIDLPQNRVKYVRNVDVFSSLMGIVQDTKPCMQGPLASNQLFSSNTTNYQQTIHDCLKSDYNSDNTVRFIQTLRLVMTSAHFTYHIEENIPFTCHRNFNFIESAKKHDTTMIANRTSSATNELKRKRKKRY